MTSATPEVTVVMANYNGAAHIAAAIRSVLRQTLSDLELIVVDDASTDASVALAEQALAGDPRARLLRQDRNGGPGAARNRALDQARGRWVAIFDSDDLMEPHRLRRLVDAARADGAEIVADNLLVFSDLDLAGSRPLLQPRDFPAPCWIGLKELAAASRMYARGPDLGYLKPMVARQLLARTGARYQEQLRIGEDYDFLARLVASGAPLRVYPEPLYRYRKHASSISHRLAPEHLRQMLAAHAAFVAEVEPLPPAEKAALDRRRRSLERALVYDEIIEGIKTGQARRSLAAGLANPAVWPLLTMPVAARLKRIAAAARPPQGERSAAA